MKRWLAGFVISGILVGHASGANAKLMFEEINMSLSEEEGLKLCDGLGRDGVIHPEQIDHIIKGFPEKMCRSEAAREKWDQKMNQQTLENDQKILIKALTEQGAQIKTPEDIHAQINIQDPKYGQTALIKACKHGDNALIKLLLEKGADIYIKSENKNHFDILDAPTMAARCIQTDTLLLLMRYGVPKTTIQQSILEEMALTSKGLKHSSNILKLNSNILKLKEIQKILNSQAKTEADRAKIEAEQAKIEAELPEERKDIKKYREEYLKYKSAYCNATWISVDDPACQFNPDSL